MARRKRERFNADTGLLRSFLGFLAQFELGRLALRDRAVREQRRD